MAESSYQPTADKPRFYATIDHGPHREGLPDLWCVWERISEFGSARRDRCADENEALQIADAKNKEE